MDNRMKVLETNRILGQRLCSFRTASMFSSESLNEAIDLIKKDRDLRRGFRKGIGIMLASWVLVQIFLCTLWPVLSGWIRP